MSQINPSASLVSLATTESDAPATPSSSTAALVPKPAPSTASPAQTPARTPVPTPPAKNYEEAFAALSSSYGFAGAVPTKNPKKDKKSKKGDGQVQTKPAGHAPGSAQGGSPSAGDGEPAPAK